MFALRTIGLSVSLSACLSLCVRLSILTAGVLCKYLRGFLLISKHELLLFLPTAIEFFRHVTGVKFLCFLLSFAC